MTTRKFMIQNIRIGDDTIVELSSAAHASITFYKKFIPITAENHLEVADDLADIAHFLLSLAKELKQ